MIKKMLKKQNGIIISDAMIATLIILLFAGIIISLITNIILEITQVKIYSRQMELITKIFEFTEKSSYESVTEENLIKCINDKQEESVSAGRTVEELTTPYKVAIKVEKYADMEGKDLDVIKIITVTVENKLQEKKYTTTMTRLKKANLNEIKELLN